jgi:uncharacterized membrane protein YeiH
MATPDVYLSWAHTTVEATANLAFALSGLLAGIRKRLHVVGLCVVTALAAFGGGTLRDVLLERRPFFWVAHSEWLWIVIGLCAGAMLFLRSRHYDFTERAIQWPDALGLGLFCATGTQLGMQQHLPAIVAVLMGVFTAVFGGVLRDIVCNEIPAALRDRSPYAVCAFVGGWVYVLADRSGMGPGWALLPAATAVALRTWALLSGYELPTGRSVHREH